jgi:hypothetical protein
MSLCIPSGGSLRQIPRRTIIRPRVQIAPGCGDRGVTKGGLHERDGRPAVECMAGVGMAQPVGGSGHGDSGFRCGLLDDAVDLHRREVPALIRSEHRIPFPGLTAERDQFAPDPRGQQHHPRLAALAEDGDLAGILARLQVAPGERAQLGDAQRAGVKQPE